MILPVPPPGPESPREAKSPTPPPNPSPVKRNRRSLVLRWFLTFLLLALLSCGVSNYLQQTGEPPRTDDIRSVRVWNHPSADRAGEPPKAETSDPAAVAGLAGVLDSAREHQDHKCGSCGVILLDRSFGRTERLEFLPGHSPEWYEFRYGRKAYRVPRRAFVDAMKRIGVDVPLDCNGGG